MPVDHFRVGFHAPAQRPLPAPAILVFSSDETLQETLFVIGNVSLIPDIIIEQETETA